jgi:hypothetical protein
VDVHVKSLRPKYNDLTEWMNDPNNVYVGRKGVLILNGERFPKKDSIWANSYTVKKYGREEALKLYEETLRERLESDPDLVRQLMKLKGKTLGCWCLGEPCHGEILIKLMNEYDELTKIL